VRKGAKNYFSQISTGDDGYFKYQRLLLEEGGQISTIQNNDIDNRWVVPFSLT